MLSKIKKWFKELYYNVVIIKEDHDNGYELHFVNDRIVVIVTDTFKYHTYTQKLKTQLMR